MTFSGHDDSTINIVLGLLLLSSSSLWITFSWVLMGFHGVSYSSKTQWILVFHGVFLYGRRVLSSRYRRPLTQIPDSVDFYLVAAADTDNSDNNSDVSGHGIAFLCLRPIVGALSDDAV